MRSKKRGLEIPVASDSTTFSLARILGHETYDTDPLSKTADTLKAYQGWIYSCVSTISSDVRQARWGIWQKTGGSEEEWKRLDEAQVPSTLLRPNASQTWGDLIEITQVHLDLSGKAFWHLITNPGSSEVVGIQILNPDWVEGPIFNDAKTRQIAWKVVVPGAGRVDISTEDVIFYRYPDPVDPYGGMSPLRAVAMSHDMDTYARAYGAQHLRNHAQPTGILTTEAELTKEQANSLSDNWKDAHLGTDNIQVLGKGATYQPLSAMIRDLEFLNLARVSRDQILSAYHIPSSRLGLIENSSRANGEESDRVYTSLCLSPRLRRYEQPITLNLLGRIGLDPSQYSFVFDSVDVADKEFMRISSSEAFSKGAITLNEYRSSIGFGPDANGKGDVYFIPAGAMVSEEPESSISLLPPGLASMETISESRSLREVEQGEELASLRFLSGHDTAERRLRSKIRSLFTREGKRIIAAVRDGTLSITMDDMELRAVGDDIFSDMKTSWLTEIQEEISSSILVGYKLFPEDAALGVAVDYEMVNPRTIRYARRMAAREVKSIQDGTRKVLNSLIKEGLEEGWSTNKLATKISDSYDIFKGSRSQMIARTETGAALNFGKHTHALAVEDEFDLTLKKTWLPALGNERTREWHRVHSIRDSNGNPTRTIPIKDKFWIGKEGSRKLMDRPHDPSGGADNVINCRCVLTYSD